MTRLIDVLLDILCVLTAIMCGSAIVGVALNTFHQPFAAFCMALFGVSLMAMMVLMVIMAIVAVVDLLIS